jgi:hypothetical protein
MAVKLLILNKTLKRESLNYYSYLALKSFNFTLVLMPIYSDKGVLSYIIEIESPPIVVIPAL